jgi:hypothetical protein
MISCTKKNRNILIHLFLTRGNGTRNFFIFKLIVQGLLQLYNKDPYH